MDGIDRITQKIINDAKAQADSITREASAAAEKKLGETKLTAEKISADAEQQAKKRKEEILREYESAANSNGKKLVLSAKHELINMSFKTALDELCALPSAEYFDLLCKIAKKYSSEGKSQLMLGKKDRGRMPSDFEAKLAEISGGSITLSPDVAEIENGFVLKFSTMEENCSFDALISANGEKLQDAAAQILFA